MTPPKRNLAPSTCSVITSSTRSFPEGLETKVPGAQSEGRPTENSSRTPATLASKVTPPGRPRAGGTRPPRRPPRPRPARATSRGARGDRKGRSPLGVSKMDKGAYSGDRDQAACRGDRAGAVPVCRVRKHVGGGERARWRASLTTADPGCSATFFLRVLGRVGVVQCERAGPGRAAGIWFRARRHREHVRPGAGRRAVGCCPGAYGVDLPSLAGCPGAGRHLDPGAGLVTCRHLLLIRSVPSL